jgi:PAS domain S-box-containing protein
VVSEDISERKRGEEALRLSEERFRLFIEGVQDYAIFMLSPEGHVVSWNAGAGRIKGYKADEIIGKHFSCFFPQEAVAQGKPEMELQIAREQGHTEHEDWRVRKDGKQFWASVAISALFDNEGSLLGFAKITRDMTERRRIEHALYVKSVQLQDAAKAKDLFLANMSHELRTPLNGIIGFAEFLVDGKPGTLNVKQTEYLGDILNSGRRLLQLISDVLDLARLEAGKIELSPERFALREAIEQVCSITKAMAQKKRIQIEIDVAPELGEVTLDQQRFKQALHNLLSNAIKFSDNGGTVEILAANHEARRFRLVVKDTGIGIKPEDFQRLFREFEQLESGATRRYEGTGLGLALTRKIMELQGGTINVESVVGKGSSFTIELPLVIADINV